MGVHFPRQEAARSSIDIAKPATHSVSVEPCETVGPSKAALYCRTNQLRSQGRFER
jgi:hypothetical protein